MNENWITAWGWIYGLALTAFFLLVLFIIPPGYRDMRRLFRDLGQEPPRKRGDEE